VLVGVEEAQERFEELMARAAAGEEILIGEGERIVKLVPIAAKHPDNQKLPAVSDLSASDSRIEDGR
jgi:antitoxin (DNA-binding transcriptional repressor) of toxin-antitoxin stability system